MAMRDFFDRLKKNAENKLNPPKPSPEEEKQKRKDDARKTFEQMNRALDIAKKGLKIRGDVLRRKKAVEDGVARKTIDLADKAAPIADKIDEKLAEQDKLRATGGMIGRGLKSAGAGAAGMGRNIKARGQKLRDAAAARFDPDRPKSDKPTTGSGLLDFLAPAVPENAKPKPKPTPMPEKKLRRPKK